MTDESNRDQRELLESLFKTMTEGVVVIDTAGRIVQANPAVETIVGRVRSEFEGRNFNELRWKITDGNGKALTPESWPASIALRERRPVRGVLMGIQRPDHSTAWIQANAAPLVNDSGEIDGIVCTFADVTESRRGEQALRESEAKLRAQFRGTPIPTYIWRAQGDDVVLVDYNDAAAKITRGGIADYLGIKASEMYCDAPQVCEEFARCLTEKVPIVRTMPYRFKSTGELKLLDVKYTFAPPDTVMVHTDDITERARTEEALRESEEQLRSVVSSMDDLVFVLDRNCSFTSFYQPSKVRTLYVSPEEFLGKPLEAVLPPRVAASARAAIGETFISGNVQQFDYPLEVEGEERWYSAKISRWRGADGAADGVTVVSREITQQRRLQQELEAAHADLEKRVAERTRELIGLRKSAEQLVALRERERLARELHDSVTQTLFSASLISDALPAVWEQDPEKGRNRLADLRNLTRDALSEMRRLLLELRPPTVAATDLGDLLRQTVDSISGRTGLKIQVDLDGPADLPPALKVALYRIAQEALNNTSKHASADRATLTLRQRPGYVELTVADDGQGFDPDPITPDGMGLSIMRERAEAVGARLAIESRQGRGTRVSVTWEKGANTDR